MAERIFEHYDDQLGNPVNPESLMTEEQKARGRYYATEYLLRRGELDLYKKEWDELQKLYQCDRDPDPSDPNYPNSFIAVLAPNVEGQIASMLESEIEFTHMSNNPAHQRYMSSLDEASAYIRRKNQFNRFFKDFARLYDLLGNAWLVISWQKDVSPKRGQPSGLPKLTVPPVLSVLVDGRIKDAKDLQHAEYIIHEIGFQSIAWARRTYGDAKADALLAGLHRYDGNNPDVSYDDSRSFMLLHVWTRSNPDHNLQLIEMDQNGFILRESPSDKPYYKNVDNEYPFCFVRMIPQQGKFYGYGDGKLLKPIQRTVNSLTDELELAARFSAQQKIFVDPDAKMDMEQLNSDPSKPVIAKNPMQNIRFSQGTGANAVIPQMIEFLLREAQRVTRFSDLMTGQSVAASSTATSVNAQMLQGSVGIKDKKSDLAEAMAWVDMYCLKLCLEKWEAPFWAHIEADRAKYIDLDLMRHAPAAVPPSEESLQMYYETAGDDSTPPPEFDLVMDENGIKETDFDFSTRVVIGQSMAKGKTDMFNMILALIQVKMLSDDGTTVVPLLSPNRAKQLLEETLGFKLTAEEDEMLLQAGSLDASGLNPVGSIPQMPVGAPVKLPADNLASTVPGLDNMDKRGMQL